MSAHPELLAVFHDEVAETLDSLAQCLETLRKPTDGHAKEVDAAFRHAHNLKGAARMVGHDTVVAITHTMEDVLSGYRDSGEAPTAALVATMLEALTVIERAVEGGDQTAAAQGVVDRMLAGGGGDGAPDAPQPALATPVQDVETTAANVDDDPAPARAAAPTADTPRGEEAGTAAPAAAGEDTSGTGTTGSVRVDVARLDRLMGYTGELLVAHSGQAARLERLERLAGALRQHMRSVPAEQRAELERLWREADELVLDTRQGVRASGYLNDEITTAMKRLRMLPLSGLAAQWRRTVREASQETGRSVTLSLEVGDIEVDKHVLDALRDPIMHLLRNAVGHGIEDASERQRANKPPVGKVAVRARIHGARVAISVTDDGRGFDVQRIAARAVERDLVAQRDVERMSSDEMLELLFLPGFSTADTVSHLSGRGVGLDVVRSQVEALAGEVHIATDAGLGGGTFEMLIPLSLASDRGLLVQVGDTVAVLGMNDVERTLLVSTTALKEVANEQVLELEDGAPLVVRSLAGVLGETEQRAERFTIVVVRHGRSRVGLMVSAIVGEERFVTKRLPWNLGSVPGVQGGVILADGRVCLVLDVAHLVNARAVAIAPPAEPEQTKVTRVLVVDDSVTSRTLERNILRSAGYEVVVAKDGEEGWQTLQNTSVDLVVSDVEMPRCTGLELSSRIRGSEQHRDLPIILVTSLGSEDDLSAGAQAGADEYIVKGQFDQRQLLEAVARLT